MIFGLFSGIFWALDTIVLSYISAFVLIICFFHDFIAVWLLFFTSKINLKKQELKILILAGIAGGLGMILYLLGIYLSSASIAGVLSSLYPIFSAVLAHFVLREYLSLLGYFGLVLAIFGTFMLFNINLSEFSFLGAFCALGCAFCWGSECVIVKLALNKGTDEKTALFIRQCVSSFFSFVGILVVFSLGKLDFSQSNLYLVCVASVLGTISYLFYYKAISKLGALKAMGLNISYSAWIVVFGVFFGSQINMYLLLCALIIIFGCLLSNAKTIKIEVK